MMFKEAKLWESYEKLYGQSVELLDIVPDVSIVTRGLNTSKCVYNIL
jgi:hypothetical protein